jgi:hypothetical protein
MSISVSWFYLKLVPSSNLTRYRVQYYSFFSFLSVFLSGINIFKFRLSVGLVGTVLYMPVSFFFNCYLLAVFRIRDILIRIRIRGSVPLDWSV